MAHKITITQTTRTTTAVEVPADLAKEFAEVYDALAPLSSFNKANVDFDDAAEARLYTRQGKAWAESHGLTFKRYDTRANPVRVSFRIYKPEEKSE